MFQLREIRDWMEASEQATALKWQAVYSYMISHTVATAWHYPVLRRRYTHKQVVVHIHDSEDTEESLPVIEMLSVP